MTSRKQDSRTAANASGRFDDYVTMTIAGQLFGIPVLKVQDVLGPQRITKIPLSPPEVAGSLNLRGRIVTAIDVRRRLGLPPSDEPQKMMSIAVDYRGELYSLIVDQVGEVRSVPLDAYERNPATLDSVWREISTGIFRLDDSLLVVIDVAKLLNFTGLEAA